MVQSRRSSRRRRSRSRSSSMTPLIQSPLLSPFGRTRSQRRSRSRRGSSSVSPFSLSGSIGRLGITPLISSDSSSSSVGSRRSFGRLRRGRSRSRRLRSPSLQRRPESGPYGRALPSDFRTNQALLTAMGRGYMSKSRRYKL